MTRNRQYFRQILTAHYQQVFFEKLHRHFLPVLSANLLYVFILAVCESVWYLPPAVKQAALGLFGLNIFFVIYIGKALIYSFSKNEARDKQVLLELGELHGRGDALLVHFQLSRREDDFSRYAVERYIREHPRENFEPETRSKESPARIALGTISLLLFFLAVFLFRPSLERLTRPQEEFLPDYPWDVSFSIPDTTLFSGDSCRFEILRRAPKEVPVFLFSADAESAAPNWLLSSQDSLTEYSIASAEDDMILIAALKRPTFFYPRPFLLRDTLRVSVIRRPELTDLSFRISYPAYSGRPDDDLTRNVDAVHCLPGSRVTVRAELSRKAGISYMEYGKEKIRFHEKDQSLISVFHPDSSADLRFMIRDRNRIALQDTPIYRLEIDTDHYPEITVLQPERRTFDLSADLQIPLLIEMSDDYGLKNARLNYRVRSPYGSGQDTSFMSFPLPHDETLRYEKVAYFWDLPGNISPGSRVEFYALVNDNDDISGPKTGRSKLFTAVLPTVADMFSRLTASQDENARSLETLRESAGKQQEALQELQRQLLQDDALSWEERAGVQDAADKLQAMQDPVSRLKDQLEKQLNMMKENKMFSDETMAAYEELQKLADELFDEEMLDLLKQIQEKLKQDEPKDMDKLVKQLDKKEEAFRKNLDRLSSIFKRIRQEQRLEALQEMLKDALKKQTDILEKKENTSDGDLARKESGLANETEAIKDLGEKSRDLFNPEQRQAMSDFTDRMNDLSPSGDMRRAAESYSQGQRPQGDRSAEEARKDLQQLASEFGQMADNMMGQQKAEITGALRMIFQKTMLLSFAQEKLINYSGDLPDGSPLYGDIMVDEGKILSQAMVVYEDLEALSQKTFLIDKNVGQAAGSTIASLRTVLSRLEDTQWRRGKTEMSQSLAAMNRLGRLLLERRQQASESGGNASGMENYLQQLQQMAGQQGSINQGMPQPGPSMNPGGGMDEMSRLAARQQALRRALKALKQQLDEAGQSKSVAGDLDRIAKEMEDVISDLRRRQVTQRTLQKQERIQQRLLDASRSAKTKEQDEKRSSKTAGNVDKIAPDGLPVDLGERQTLIRELLREIGRSDLTPAEKREMEMYLQFLRSGDMP